MKEGWQTKKLGEVCEVIAGQSPEGRYYNSDGVGLPFYQGKKEFTDKLIGEPTTWTTKTTKLAQNGDILMSVRAPVGPVNFATEDICIGRGLAAIRCKEGIDRDFLFYQMLHLQPQLSGQEGAVFASINKAGIENLPLAYTSAPEQKRTVAKLDEAFEGIAKAKENAEKNAANARAVFESELNAIFTKNGKRWEEKRIVDVCLTFGRGKSRHRPRNEPSLYGGDYPFIQTGDLSNADHVVTSYTQTYSEKGLAQSKLWPRGTVGIAIVGATIGETGVLGFDGCFPDSIIGMTVDADKADPFFIEYMLQYFKETIKSQGEGSARHNINLGTFDKLIFPMPLVTEQQRLVEIVDSLRRETRRLESIYERKLSEIDALKNSLLHDAFTGHL